VILHGTTQLSASSPTVVQIALDPQSATHSHEVGGVTMPAGARHPDEPPNDTHDCPNGQVIAQFPGTQTAAAPMIPQLGASSGHEASSSQLTKHTPVLSLAGMQRTRESVKLHWQSITQLPPSGTGLQLLPVTGGSMGSVKSCLLPSMVSELRPFTAMVSVSTTIAVASTVGPQLCCDDCQMNALSDAPFADGVTTISAS
jgi:hypothetical protein